MGHHDVDGKKRPRAAAQLNCPTPRQATNAQKPPHKPAMTYFFLRSLSAGVVKGRRLAWATEPMGWRWKKPAFFRPPRLRGALPPPPPSQGGGAPDQPRRRG